MYEAVRSPYVGAQTIRMSYRVVKRSLLSVLGDKPAEQVTSVDLLLWLQQHIGKQRSPSGINSYVRVIRGLGNWAAQQNVLPQGNPFASLKLLKEPARPIRFLTQAEFQRVYLAEHLQVYRDMYVVGLVTGLRLGDVLGLRWSMIDVNQRVLIVVNTKANRVLRLPMHSGLLPIFERQRAAAPDSETIWGKLLTVSYVSKRFLAERRRAHVEHASFHTLRKTFASWLVKSGAAIFDVQKLLGHSTPMLTSKYYAHLQPDALGAQVEMLMPLTGSFVAAGVVLASSVTGELTTLPPTTWQVSKPRNWHKPRRRCGLMHKPARASAAERLTGVNAIALFRRHCSFTSPAVACVGSESRD